MVRMMIGLAASSCFVYTFYISWLFSIEDSSVRRIWWYSKMFSRLGVVSIKNVEIVVTCVQPGDFF